MNRLAFAGFVALLFAGGALTADAAWRAASLRGAGADWGPAEQLLAGNGAEAVRIEASLVALTEADVDGLILREGGRAFTRLELESLDAFVSRGGRVLILGEPQAARAFGVEIVPQRILASTHGELRATPSDGREGPMVPDARPLLGQGEPTLFANASAFVDVDGDGRAGAPDAAGPFTVAMAVAEGNVVVFGSAGLLSGERLADGPTEAYARDQLDELFPPGSRVALEASRTDDGHRARDAALAAALDVSAAPWPRAIVLCALVAAGACFAAAARGGEKAIQERDAKVPLPPELGP